MENWKPIKETNGNYDVSNLGRVRSYLKQSQGCYIKVQEPQRIIKLQDKTHGYKTLQLWINRKNHTRRVHRLVLEAFIGKCPEGMECCHNDGNKNNNNLENLRWDTHRNNMLIDGGAKGIIGKGEQNPASKLKETTVRTIKQMAKLGIYTHQEIANYLGLHRRNVSKIIQGTRWSHIVI